MPVLRPSVSSLKKAVSLLKSEELVVFPTETVYGLGADATSDMAVMKIFRVKKRPLFNPLIVHCHSKLSARKIGYFDETSEKLAKYFWPGPLTMVLPKLDSANISALVTSGHKTVALRVPKNRTTRKLIKLLNRPIAGPSANPSGKLSPTNAIHVNEKIGKKINLIIDDGSSIKGIESTVVLVERRHVHLLRHGAITKEEIEKVIGKKLVTNKKNKLISPGMIKKHYAPSIPLRLNAKKVFKNEGLLAFGNDYPKGALKTLNLSERGNLEEAAYNLFSMLHELEKLNIKKIAVSNIPNFGMGKAINDRLKRGAS